MALDDEFFVTAGSVVGRDHVRLHKNNQDGVALAVRPDVIVAAVTDGCSSGKHSEVGARLAASWLASWVPEMARSPELALAAEVPRQLVRWIGAMLSQLAPPQAGDALVGQFFLFTYLVAVITPERTQVFGQGDGVVSVNGDARVIDSGPDNAPDYLAYECVRPEILSGSVRRSGQPRTKIYHDGPTAELRTLAIGTDGVADVLHPELSHLENDDRYLRNATLVHKRLIVLGDGERRLRDDTTLALVRRRAVAA